MPEKYNNYYEPFIGGGALLFELMPKKAIINDANQELLAIYKCLASEEDFKLMITELERYEKMHSEEYYYKVREEDRTPFRKSNLGKSFTGYIFKQKLL